MELKVRNFAKIAEADIIIDGITVIAGNNNTGKSTIGKILDVIFNTTNNISAKMNKARIDSLNDMLQKELEQILVKENFHLIGEGNCWSTCSSGKFRCSSFYLPALGR